MDKDKMTNLTDEENYFTNQILFSTESEMIAKLKTERTLIEENFDYIINRNKAIAQPKINRLRNMYLNIHREENVSRIYREGFRMAIYGNSAEDIMAFYTGLKATNTSINDFIQGLQLGDFKTGDDSFGELVNLLSN